MAQRLEAAPVELYVYYRVPADAQDAALTDIRQRQRALEQRWPGLRARLLQRAEATGPEVTCMETYVLPEGIDAAMCGQLEAAMAACPLQRVGPRQVERFVAVPPD